MLSLSNIIITPRDRRFGAGIGYTGRARRESVCSSYLHQPRVAVSLLLVTRPQIPPNSRTIFTHLQSARVIVPDFSSIPLVEASIRVPSLKTFALTITNINEAWPPKTLTSNKMNITNVYILPGLHNCQINSDLTTSHSVISCLSKVLQSIAELQTFAIIYQLERTETKA